jgi:hypothetical protein
MTDNTFDSTGTELYLCLDGTTVAVFDCPTAINGLGFTSAEMSTGCLTSTVNTTRPGRKTLSPVTVPFRLISGSETHEWIVDQANLAASEIPYFIGLSDGTADPTVAAGVFVNAGGAGTETRSGFKGTCYVSAVTIDVNDGEVVTGSFTFHPQSFTPVRKV